MNNIIFQARGNVGVGFLFSDYEILQSNLLS